jgi:hypothetical protein
MHQLKVAPSTMLKKCVVKPVLRKGRKRKERKKNHIKPVRGIS